jgi:hypothetical protein
MGKKNYNIKTDNKTSENVAQFKYFGTTVKTKSDSGEN